MWSRALVFLIAISACVCQDRKLKSYLNPGCKACEFGDTTLLYTRCDGQRDSVHQLWDFTGGRPTVIIAVTDTNSSLSIDWDAREIRGFTWSNSPKYSFVVVIDEIWEYNDVNDTATWDPALETDITMASSLTWKRVNLVQRDTDVKLKMVAGSTHSFNSSGTITVELELVPGRDYGLELPHLVHSSNSSLVSVSLAALSGGRYNASRFAVRLLLASSDPASLRVAQYTRDSLDDEHTPGVFKTVNLLTPEAVANGDGGFIQYRPVAYTAEPREVTASTVVGAGPVLSATLPRRSTVRRFYRGRDVLSDSVLVTLGGDGDGFYTRTNYTAWAFTVGYGSSPVEGFSLYVVLVISVGLAVPVLLLLGGGSYAVACRRRHAGHQRLRD